MVHGAEGADFNPPADLQIVHQRGRLHGETHLVVHSAKGVDVWPSPALVPAQSGVNVARRALQRLCQHPAILQRAVYALAEGRRHCRRMLTASGQVCRWLHQTSMSLMHLSA